MSAIPKPLHMTAAALSPVVPWTFDLSRVQGLSQQGLAAHLELYATYVKEANMLLEQLQGFPRQQPLTPTERLQRDGLVRRMAYEHNGVRLHEAFFEALSGSGPKPSPAGAFHQAVKNSFGSLSRWQADVAELAMTRGVGWVVTYRCRIEGHLSNVWVDDHTHGLLLQLTPLVVFDLWEHAYLPDFKSNQRAAYIDVLFANLNWQVIEQRCLD